jgi:hypothetical protein
MKTLLENWNRFLLREELEQGQKIYYWQAKGEWRGDKPIEYGVTHVPQAIPLQTTIGSSLNHKLEDLLERARLEVDPSLPSRLSCAYVCDLIQKGYIEHEKSLRSFCKCGSEKLITYKVIIKPGATIYRANSAILGHIIYDQTNLKDKMEAARFYWKGIHPEDPSPSPEVLVSPASSVIIVGKLEGC